jgi:hypothetical protein
MVRGDSEWDVELGKKCQRSMEKMADLLPISLTSTDFGSMGGLGNGLFSHGSCDVPSFTQSIHREAMGSAGVRTRQDDNPSNIQTKTTLCVDS